ncbi:MAG: twin-arginine translocase subunit TatC [Planctomycetes bacterium]|nr:twin-arginine translocase subunit TatC [Planctomycetota bacterium]
MAKIRKHLDPEHCVMSLGDHLEELRARLILAILGLIVGVAVSLIFGKQILSILEWPYNRAVRDRSVKQVQADVPRREAEALGLVNAFFHTLTDRLASDPNAPHDLDPKRVAFLQEVSAQAVKEWVRAQHEVAGYELPALISLAPAEAFMAYMKIAMIAGLIFTCPWVFYQLWMFVAAGLYPKERQYVYKAVPFSAALFITGALFFLFVIAYVTLRFFLLFGDTVNVASQWTLQKYVSFVTLLMLVFGLAFQTPIIVFILVRTGLVSIKTLRAYRKYVLLGLAILAAVATPSPDPLSMLALLFPLYGLYEVGIILSIRAAKKAEQKKAEETASA